MEKSRIAKLATKPSEHETEVALSVAQLIISGEFDRAAYLIGVTPTKDLGAEEKPSELYHIAIQSSAPLKVFQALFDKGLDCNVKNSFGYSPLALTLFRLVEEDVIRFLAERTEELNQPLPRGESLLVQAIERGPKPLLAVLIEAGADMTIQDLRGRTLLSIAVEADRDIETIECLLKAGVDPTLADRSGFTPLLYATYYDRRIEILAMLMRFGASINRSYEGVSRPMRSAIALARILKKQNVILVMERCSMLQIIALPRVLALKKKTKSPLRLLSGDVVRRLAGYLWTA